MAAFALEVGRDDAALRIGRRPARLWAPECGYRPGLEDIYQQSGVTHFMVDGPTLLGVDRATADAWTVGDSDVVAFGRDLDVTYRVWSPKKGYPGGQWYRDFHTFDHDTESGHRASRRREPRVPTRRRTTLAARAAVEADAHDFVDVVRRRLTELRAQRDGKSAPRRGGI